MQIAAINKDGYVYQTNNFEADSPAWTRVLPANLSGTPVQFVVDAFCPAYQAGGGSLDGWIATTTGIYKVTDLLGGTPAATLQHTFRASSSLRSMDFGFGVQGHGACVSMYDDGVYITYTLDGGETWSAEISYGTSPVPEAYFTGEIGTYSGADGEGEGDYYVSALADGNTYLRFVWEKPPGAWPHRNIKLPLVGPASVSQLVIEMRRTETENTCSSWWEDCPGDLTTHCPGFTLHYGAGHYTNGSAEVVNGWVRRTYNIAYPDEINE